MPGIEGHLSRHRFADTALIMATGPFQWGEHWTQGVRVCSFCAARCLASQLPSPGGRWTSSGVVLWVPSGSEVVG